MIMDLWLVKIIPSYTFKAQIDSEKIASKRFTLMSEPISGNGKSFYKDENVFYFSLLRYFDFYRDFLVVQKNGLLRKLRLISKFMTS